VTLAAGCTGLDALNPICQVGSLGGSLASAGLESVLSSISQWVASGAEWLLTQVGDVLTATTTVDVGAAWFRTHYGDMSALAGVVVLPLLLASTLQAVLGQNPGQLVRTFLLRLPLALLLAGVVVQVVILSLSATDAMSDAVAGGTGADVTSLLTGITSGLVEAAADPTLAGFVLLLIAFLIAVAAFVLWLELLIRAAAVYVAVLFMPLALASLVWPAVSHWCRRLVETPAALILSKFVIVATLSLAAGAVSSGTAGSGTHGAGFSAVLAGGALLVIATFAPFAILRLIPAVEAGAVGHLEGLRQRGTTALMRVPRTAAAFALQEGLGALGDARLLAEAGEAGEAAGPGGVSGAAGPARARAARGARTALGAPAPPVSAGAGPDDVVGPNGETLAELLAQVTPENGGQVADASGHFIGETESQRIWDDMTAQDPLPSQPRGPKPIVATTPVAPWERPGRATPGPQTPEEAWKWEGVPPGCGLLGPVEPGKMRHYLGNDGHGPQIRWLPPAWPPGAGVGDGPDAGPPAGGPDGGG